MLYQQSPITITPLIMNNLLIFNFNSTKAWSGWEIQNDVVMGGNSFSKLERSKEGNAIFKGYVSLKNNGGFASVHYKFAAKDISNYKKAYIKLKGDGKNYQFRVKSNIEDKASYIYIFKTTGDWQTVEIPLKEMIPTYRGRSLNIPNFSANKIQEVRFLIGNKRAENFRLEMSKIALK
ncbi:CIA30 family protein [Salegentibacter sp. BLCTC]|nr:CIA30 family protein [Salegentibacter sp. BLCTC]